MAGEEGAVLDAWRAAGGGARTLLVLAPRHPERWAEGEGLLRAGGVVALRRSRLEEAETAAPERPAERSAGHGAERPEGLLLDSMGELAGIYGDATAAFIGGTLVPTGGHNPL